ncbi:MAG: beta-phosphoglucomutase [Anaerolineaceae bacterium]|jgi:beta-phosphoglucomutase|nr:beta-phosphoglucomutase [Anaerolineaceae bacterium]MDD4042423.1 beta-phosphoglucomutase [Anaerolineaceae bacterium]MDD4578575.1 beta-phosphoglucomutase [Anaerolineaceae bacterium]
MIIKAFLFDLDGVLTDTSEFHFQGWKRLADEEGIPFSREDNEALRGVSRRESLKLLLKGRPVSEMQAQEMMERKNSYYIDLVRQMTPADLLPGAREIIAEINALGLKQAIVSSSKNAELVLGRLQIGELFDAVIDGNALARSKPHPDLFLLAAEALAVPPENCLVVEDAEAGVAAAHAAGMPALGLGPADRVGKAELVFASLADHTAHEILELLEDS